MRRSPDMRRGAEGRRLCRCAPIMATLLMAIVGASCRTQPSAPVDLAQAGALAEAQASLVPARLMVHPLTRIGTDGAGRPALLLHVEFRDQFEQNTRALGVMRVTVQRWARDRGGDPGEAPVVAPEEPAPLEGPGGTLSWEVDLRDPARNALLYDDLVTRTYAVTLTGLPSWLVEWAEEPGPVTEVGNPAVSVSFEFPSPRDPGGPPGRVFGAARLTR